MRLFREKGFDNVTIAEIAEAADVDVTTFWRHFRSKHALLFADREVWLTELRARLDAAPQDLPAFDAAVQGLTQAVASVEMPATEELRTQILRSDPAPEVHAAILMFEDLTRAELERAIALRLGIDPHKDPAAAVLSAAVMAAASWMRSQHSRRAVKFRNADIGMLVRGALAQIPTAAMTAAPAAPPAKRRSGVRA
jgi:AcrR family transcriptional regulator